MTIILLSCHKSPPVVQPSLYDLPCFFLHCLLFWSADPNIQQLLQPWEKKGKGSREVEGEMVMQGGENSIIITRTWQSASSWP